MISSGLLYLTTVDHQAYRLQRAEGPASRVSTIFVSVDHNLSKIVDAQTNPCIPTVGGVVSFVKRSFQKEVCMYIVQLRKVRV